MSTLWYRNLLSFLNSHSYRSTFQIEKNEMGGECSTYGDSRSVYKGKLRERDHMEDPDVDRRIMLKWIFSK